MSEVNDNKHAYKWMKKSGLKAETDALITAAQEQGLNTNSKPVVYIHLAIVSAECARHPMRQ
jgi:hypothetical protein